MAPAIAAALAVIAAVRVGSTYSVFCETVDEPDHIAAGMEWLDRGSYRYDVEDPPLGRVCAALLPYLAGLRSQSLPDFVQEGNRILYANGHYIRNLTLARLGILPFLFLATAAIWFWTRRVFGDFTAVLAVALFSTLPPVLALSGLATTDAALTATLMAALVAFLVWLEGPTLPRGAALGLAGGVAILSKFSALLFFPCAAAAILAVRWLAGPRGARRKSEAPSRLAASSAIAVLTTCTIVWAGYRFSSRRIDSSFIRLPAPELIDGIRELRAHNARGHPAYLLGRQSGAGWWYYFPVALSVKTPLAFLLLAGAGALFSFRLARGRRDWRVLAPPAAALAILLACLPSRINIGIRHLLPIYAPLAIVASVGLAGLWRIKRFPRAARTFALAMLAWQAVSSARAHPEYLAYFNELASEHPERVLLDSNLDWGQDLLRLSHDLRKRHIPSVAICYFGNADIHRHGLPHVQRLLPYQPRTGWIAISEMCLLDPGFAWLKMYKPVARAGSSIRLYYVAR